MKIVNRIDPSYECLQDNYQEDITVLVDCSIILDDEDNENSYAFLSEPNQILSRYLSNSVDVFSEISHRLKAGKHKFKRLYTAFKFFEGHPNTVILNHTPLPSWIASEEEGIHQKHSDLCFVTSTKGWTTQQHERVHLADWLQQNGIVVYGQGYNPIERKVTVLGPSRFCICIENENLEGYHTEKVVDCFATGTIPLYVGDPKIGEKYDSNGMYTFDSVSSLRQSDVFSDILGGKGSALYESKKREIEENFNRYLSYKDYRSGDFVFNLIVRDML